MERRVTTYDVKTGLNLGINNKRFEPNSTITQTELKELCSDEGVEVLVERGYIVEKPTPKKAQKKSRSATSSAGSDKSAEEE